jgi:small ligand-binding sensory domain FIST
VDVSPTAAVQRAVAQVAAALPGARAEVAFLFLAREHAGAAEEALAAVRAGLGSPVVVGCGAGGVLGAGREYERTPAVSLLVGASPGMEARAFHVTDDGLPDLDGPQDAWHRATGAPPSASPGFVLVADPYTIRADALVAGLDFAYPGAVTVGGLASGASRPGEQVLFAGDRVERSGAVGVAVSGGVTLEPAVAQGCRPIGPAMRITRCEGQLLREVDRGTPLQALQSIWDGAAERDRHLIRSALFLGFATDPLSADDDGPWLVRNLQGVHGESGGLVVGEPLRVGRRVRFHVRDRVTSAEDVTRTLRRAGGAVPPEGALLFASLGRGTHLYGAPDHDSRAFRARFGDVPIAGFFCNGEIGPVGGETHLFGYTSSFGLLRRRDAAP